VSRSHWLEKTAAKSYSIAFYIAGTASSNASFLQTLLPGGPVALLTTAPFSATIL
jgi:hypothetical protein